MAHFPVFIDIEDRVCLVVGGGQVALRKVKTLLDYGARVRVTAIEICPEICRLVPEERRRLGPVADEEMAGALLVVAATADRDENRRIGDYCRRKRILVNVVDEPDECTFLFPSTVRRGDISIGINSGAKSPGVSAYIRGRIDRFLPDDYGRINDQMADLRALLKETVPVREERRKILREAVGKACALGRPLDPEEIRRIVRQR